MDLVIGGAAIVILSTLFCTTVLIGVVIQQQGRLREQGSPARHRPFRDDGHVNVDCPVIVGLTYAGGTPTAVLCRVSASHELRRTFIRGADNFLFNRSDWNRLIRELQIPDVVVGDFSVTVSPEELSELFTTYDQYISKSREAATRAGP